MDQNVHNVRSVKVASIASPVLTKSFTLDPNISQVSGIFMNSDSRFFSQVHETSKTYKVISYSPFDKNDPSVKVEFEFSKSNYDCDSNIPQPSFAMATVNSNEGQTETETETIAIINDPCTMNSYEESKDTINAIRLGTDKQNDLVWSTILESDLCDSAPIPIIVNNIAFLQTTNDTVYAKDLQSGETKWFKAGTDMGDWPTSDKQVAISTDLTKVFFVQSDYANKAKLLCLDTQTGNKIWETVFEDVQYLLGPPVAFKNNELYYLDDHLKIHCVDQNTGEELLNYQIAHLDSPVRPRGYTLIVDPLTKDLYFHLIDTTSYKEVILCLSPILSSKTYKVKWNYIFEDLDNCSCPTPWYGSSTIWSQCQELILTDDRYLITPRYRGCEAWDSSGSITCNKQETSILIINAENGEISKEILIEKENKDLNPIVECMPTVRPDTHKTSYVCISSSGKISVFDESTN
ncbi:quinoprotein alcohol dehydrogenase (cytochrome c) [Anaeramoeba flamelloides]|uniref:Quinoprotein alcohol dehydrogenase (Cytochrome c) n=1 Tax=Anaeramoeba flamelloides TaxID=1746091 RepID=A0ABQ8ZCV1_9EUKA|nr:quinoprotein alcohol dehydrogenase (cytochrome c) [Anaeramoeba flamelloides]